MSRENPAKGQYPVLVKEGHDLHELHALMAPRAFLMSGGSEDLAEPWIPLNLTIEVNNFLGAANRMAMINRSAQAPDPISNEHAYQFLIFLGK